MSDNSIQARQEGFLRREKSIQRGRREDAEKKQRWEQRLEELENCDGKGSIAAKSEMNGLRYMLQKLEGRKDD